MDSCMFNGDVRFNKPDLVQSLQHQPRFDVAFRECEGACSLSSGTLYALLSLWLDRSRCQMPGQIFVRVANKIQAGF